MTEYTEAVRWAIIENCTTLIVFGVVTVGLYAMGAGGWSAIGTVVLLNLNGPVRRRGITND